MPMYLCGGGSVSCGGAVCLSILARRNKASKETNQEVPAELGGTPSGFEEPSKLGENATDKKQEDQSGKDVTKELVGTEQDKASEKTNQEVPAELDGTPKNSEEPIGTEKTSQSSSKSDERLTEESLREILLNPGTTVKNPKAACRANAKLFEQGNSGAEAVTKALCADSTLLGLNPKNVARKIVSTTGCAAGTLSTSVCGFISDKWEEHCDSLPDAIIIPPSDSDIEKIIVTFPK